MFGNVNKYIIADEIMFINSLTILKARDIVVGVFPQSESCIICIDDKLNKQLENEKHSTSN